MNVVGTGSPQVLTIRFERCEIDGLRAALHRRRAAVTEAAAAAHKRARPEVGAGSDAVEGPHDELVEVSRVLNELEAFDVVDENVVELIGPTWLWAKVLRDASERAVDALADAMQRFGDPACHCRPGELRAAAAAAHAWTDTRLDYHHVDNHGMDRW
jgi:hypothetical protein